jgi:hypothetical protein
MRAGQRSSERKYGSDSRQIVAIVERKFCTDDLQDGTMVGSECAAIGAAGQTHQWCCLRPDKKASLCGCTMMMSSFGKRPTVS